MHHILVHVVIVSPSWQGQIILVDSEIEKLTPSLGPFPSVFQLMVSSVDDTGLESLFCLFS